MMVAQLDNTSGVSHNREEDYTARCPIHPPLAMNEIQAGTAKAAGSGAHLWK